MLTELTSVLIVYTLFFEVTVGDESVVVNENEEAYLPCKTTAGNQQPVDWFFQQSGNSVLINICSAGHFISEYENRSRLDTTSGGYQNLVIGQARANDSGIYTCQLNRTGQVDRKIVKLSVAHAADYVPIIPYQALVGDKVVLPCTTSTAGVEWAHKATRTDKGSLVYTELNGFMDGYQNRFILDFSVKDTFNLVIKEAAVGDAGIYMCIDGDGRKVYTKLTVLKPALPPSTETITAHVGEETMLPCLRTATDSVVSWWYRRPESDIAFKVAEDGHVFGAFSKRFSIGLSSQVHYDLTVRSPSFNDTGFYTCITDFRNGFGRKTVLNLDVRIFPATSSSSTTTSTTTTTIVIIPVTQHSPHEKSESKFEKYMSTILAFVISILIFCIFLAMCVMAKMDIHIRDCCNNRTCCVINK